MSSPARMASKRKRDDNELLASIAPLSTSSNQRFIFDFGEPRLEHSDDGSASPRSNVAHKFSGLALECGGGVGADSHPLAQPPYPSHQAGSSADGIRDVLDNHGGLMRKRQKMPDLTMADASSVAIVVEGNDTSTPAPDPSSTIVTTTTAFPSHGVSSKAAARSEQPNKPRARKRVGTPPPSSHRAPKANSLISAADGEDGDDEMEIVEPIRAALTWHEDEITVYDPDDEDDDGTGINGIGFKPSPAIAYARTQKRKKQLAEYRKREESEARSKRSQRRRGSPALPLTLEAASSPTRKVRFMEPVR